MALLVFTPEFEQCENFGQSQYLGLFWSAYH